MKARFFNIIAIVALFSAGSAARAAESPWVSADYAQARLIAGKDKAGIEIRLAPGWHAYWRMPGDGGLPPRFDWAASKNLKEAAVSWPVPRRYVDMDLHSFGYQDSLILPLALTAADADKPVDVALTLDLMVCEKICVPQKFDLALTDAVAEAGAHDARLAAVPLPHDGDTDELKIDNLVIGPDAIVAQVTAKNGFAAFDMFVDAGEALYVTAAPAVTVDEKDPHKAIVKIAAPPGTDNLFNAVTGKPLTLVVTDGRHAIERRFAF